MLPVARPLTTTWTRAAVEVMPSARWAGAEEAEGARLLVHAVPETDPGDVLAIDDEISLHPEAAAPAPGSGRVRQILVPQEPARRMDLEHLVVLGQDAARRIDEADVVVAIAAADGSRAALEGEKENVHEPPTAARVRPRDRHAEHPVPAGRDTIG